MSELTFQSFLGPIGLISSSVPDVGRVVSAIALLSFSTFLKTGARHLVLLFWPSLNSILALWL
jgi:hypothetical protein